MDRKFDTDTIRLITFFENMSGAPVKDCFVDQESSTIYFIIDEGKVGIAIGKNGSSVMKAEKIIGKKIKLFEFSKNLTTFVKKMIPQATEVNVKNDDDRIIVSVRVDKRNKAMIIGRDGKSLKIFKQILRRNHKVDDLVVK
jgi:N utilization substance protein A